MALLSATNLVKHFGDFTAVDGLTIHIPKNICFGLLGPNGAGKSTFINMIYGTAVRSSGDLKIFGMDPSIQARDIKRKLGVVTQDNALDEALTVRENMLVYAGFVGVPKGNRDSVVDHLLKFMNLDSKSNSPIVTLSGGMKRRLVFVRALLNEPELLILDEPTTGLDPAVRHLIWGRVKELRARGTTVLLTTHYIHEAEVLCDQVAIMNRGKILTIDTPANLVKAHSPGYVGIFPLTVDNLQKIKRTATKSVHVSEQSSGIVVRSETFENLMEIQKQTQITATQMRPSNLEDVFLKLTGSEISIDE